jgi:hypothetical protein
VWIAEFTRNGAIHFHVLLDCEPDYDSRICLAFYWLRQTDQGRGRYCPLLKQRTKDVASAIFSCVAHEKSWQNLQSETGGKRYIAKYACKPYQKKVPIWFRDMGRFWGMSKGIKASREDPTIITLNETELRDTLTQYHHTVGGWDVVPRHLWGVELKMFDGF